ncbi:MAG: type I restriction endonuclease [Ancrocorticia sp.]
MNSTSFTESIVEHATLAWLEALGYGIAHGPEIGCGQPGAEREDWAQVVLEGRLRLALIRLNPKVPASAIDEAFRKLTRPDSPSLWSRATTPCTGCWWRGCRLSINARTVPLGSDIVRVIDFDDPENNDFLAVNQLTVVENKHERRPDVVLYINGSNTESD